MYSSTISTTALLTGVYFRFSRSIKSRVTIGDFFDDRAYGHKVLAYIHSEDLRMDEDESAESNTSELDHLISTTPGPKDGYLPRMDDH